MNRLAPLFGLAAVLVYVATVIVGGWATPGYSHLDLPVSALFEAGARYAVPVSSAFVVYNFLLVAFAAGLAMARPELRPAAAMVLLNGAFGLVIELFPWMPPATPPLRPG